MVLAIEPRPALLSALRYRGPLSMDELKSILKLSKTATRAHVLHLEQAGLIVRVASEEVDGPGRPSARYALTECGGETFPNKDSELLEKLIVFLHEHGQTSLVFEFFQNLWKKRRKRLLKTLGVEAFAGAPRQERIRSLRRLLKEGDFMPRITTKRRGCEDLVVVRECNCPVPAAVRATKIPCKLEQAFLADVVCGQARKTHIASSRADTCSFEFVLEASS